MTISDYFLNHDFNVDGEIIDGEKLSPENEIAEYFIQHRTDDVKKAINSFNILIELPEHPILSQILLEKRDTFRNILRDGVTTAVILLNFDRDDKVNINLQSRRLRNNIKINLNVKTSIKLRELSASDYEGEIVTFEGQVSNWGKKRTITHTADYKCPDCEMVITRPFKTKIKDKCPADNVPFEFFKPNVSEDTRRINVRENNNDFSDGNLPASISADVYGKTVQEIELSDKIVVTGIFRSVPLKLENGKISQEFIPTIQVISIQNMKTDKLELPDDTLMERFVKLEQEGKLIDAVIDGFAYNIYKKRDEKKAIICSLIGSVWIGQVGKGNAPMIHILFVGDPDTYKSTIMKYIINVSDNCVLADSTTVSNAGIKAIAVKSEGDGRMVIMAGLLPTYNKGVVFLDEFGDLAPSIYADLKAPMIDGWVSKHVAGEDFEGSAETGVLAAMNPVDDVWNDSKTLLENLVILKKALITRFDLIAKFSIEFNNLHGSEIDEHFDKCDFEGKPEGVLKDEEIKLFLNFVKTINPEVTREALKRNTEYFAEIKAKSESNKNVETRTKNAVMKFAVAIARWHMCDKVTVPHVNEAIKLCSAALATLNMKFEDGEFINEATLKKTDDGRKTAIKQAFDKIKDETGYAFEDDLIDKALDSKCFVNRNQAVAIVNIMKIESKVTEKNGMVKVTS